MGHREQNSSCPVTWDDEPRGFLTEWEATPMKPTEDAKMQKEWPESVWLDAFEVAAIRSQGWDKPPTQHVAKQVANSKREYVSAARIAELEEMNSRQKEMLRQADRRADKWKARAEAAEAKVARLREAIEADCRQWFYYPIEMPVTADGEGPATVGVDAVQITYEVWDRLLSTHASFDNLPDAINEAIRLNAAAAKEAGE